MNPLLSLKLQNCCIRIRILSVQSCKEQEKNLKNWLKEDKTMEKNRYTEEMDNITVSDEILANVFRNGSTIVKKRKKGECLP